MSDTSTRSRKTSRFSTPVDEEELDFIKAIEAYKRENGQPFPSWTEVLAVLKTLGYRKRPDGSNAT